jgi:DNA uptake protein ComE-like DNA-binding protein
LEGIVFAEGRSARAAGAILAFSVRQKIQSKGDPMLRRSFVAVCVLALVWTMSLGAQTKDAPKKPVIVDINTAPEADIVSVGIDKMLAKKIVEGRPYRNKRELVTRQLLTPEQYDKVKDRIVARRVAQK